MEKSDSTRQPSTQSRRAPDIRASIHVRSRVSRLCSTMKTLLPSDRPREKLLRHGAGALGDNELVALVLGTGGRRGGALEIATELLSRVGGLHGIVRSTSEELAGVGGIG